MTGFTDRSGLGLTAAERDTPIVVATLLIRSSADAVLIAHPAHDELTVWLPRRFLTIEEGMLRPGRWRSGAQQSAVRHVRITLPAWLAAEKGLRATPDAGQGSLF